MVDDTARHRLPWILTGVIAALFVVVVLGYAVQGSDMKLSGSARRGVLRYAPTLLAANALFISLIVILIAFAVRFHHLGTQSLWNDEGNSLRLAQRSISDLIDAAGRDIHPPGYYLALKGWIALAGESEFSLRALSALAGVLTVAVTMALGRALFSRAAGIMAGLLVALSPFAVYYSQETRMYAPLGLFSVPRVCGCS